MTSKEFTKSNHCASRIHCVACRKHAPMLGMEFPVECPYGVTLNDVFQWPLPLLPLKKLAQPNDIGLGDIVKHVIGDECSDAFRAWFKRLFGFDCGCSNRQKWLNEKYPL